MAQTDPQNRRGDVKCADQIHGDAPIFRRARSGRDDDMAGMEPPDFVQRDRIITPYDDIGTKFARYCTRLYVNES